MVKASNRIRLCSELMKATSLDHDGKISDVPSSNDQSSSLLQKGEIPPSAKALMMKSSSLGVSKVSSSSLIIRLPARSLKPPSLGDAPKPLLRQKTSIDVKEGVISIKHQTKDIMPRDKSSSINKKFIKVKGGKCGSPSSERKAKKLKTSSEFLDYSVPSAELDLKRKELASVQKLIDECQMERQTEQQKLHSLQRDIEDCSKELENKRNQVCSIEGLLSSYSKDIETKEREYDTIQRRIEESNKEFESKGDQLESIRELIRGREQELRTKEEELDERQKLIEDCQMMQRAEQQSLHSLKKDIEDCNKELENKKKQVSSFQGQLSSYSRDIETKKREYGAILRNFEECNKEFEAKGEQLKSIKKMISEYEKQLRSKEEECNRKHKMLQQVTGKHGEIHRKIEECDKNLGAKKALLYTVEGLIRERKQQLISKEEELDARQKLIDCQAKERELQRKKSIKLLPKRMYQLAQDLKKTEKQCEALIKSFEEEKVPDKQLSPTADGRCSHMLSYVQTNETEWLADSDIIHNLETSLDPAKLILDIIQNPLVPRCMEEDNAIIVDRCQIILLEQLRLSPQIKPHVRDEARELALDWKANIRESNAENSVVVLAFLLLLKVYGLVSYFNEDEVLQLFELVVQHKQALELFRTFGFEDKVSDFVQNLIKKKKHIEAVGFICAYKSVETNPPVNLLREYVQNARLVCDNSCKESKSFEIKVKAIDQEIASLEIVLQCISDNNIESGVLREEIQDRILELGSLANSNIFRSCRACIPNCSNLL